MAAIMAAQPRGLLATRSVLFRLSFRYAGIQRTNKQPEPSLLQCRFSSSYPLLTDVVDARLVPLQSIGYTLEEAFDYLGRGENTYPGLTLDRIQQRISILRELGFANPDIKVIFRRKSLLNFATRRIDTNIRELKHGIGFDKAEIKELAMLNPIILVRKNLLEHFNMLVEMQGEPEEVVRNNVKVQPYLIMLNPVHYKALEDFATELEIADRALIRWLIFHNALKPFNPDEGRKCFQLLQDWGFEMDDARTAMTRVTYVATLKEETLKDKLDYLEKDVGLSKDDVKKIMMASKGFPDGKLENLKLKIDYLMNVVGMTAQQMLLSHKVLAYSAKRIKARHEFTLQCGLQDKFSIQMQVCKNIDDFLLRCGKSREEYFQFCKERF